MKFVLDASVALAWFLSDENAEAIEYANGVLKLARQEIAFAVVPSAWHEEVAAVLGLPIATLDGGIKTACRVHGVKLFEPPA